LPGADENLKGPNDKGLERTAVKLLDKEKEIMKKFTEYLVRNWPSRQLNPDLAESRHLVFADSTSFFSALFTPEFKKYIDFLKNAPAGNHSTRVGFFL
jgi:hypothetical protein